MGQTSGGSGAENGPGSDAGWKVLKEQAGNVDPGMGASERASSLQASERPLRGTGSVEERVCGVPGSIDPGEEKSTLGEWNGGTLSAP